MRQHPARHCPPAHRLPYDAPSRMVPSATVPGGPLSRRSVLLTALRSCPWPLSTGRRRSRTSFRSTAMSLRPRGGHSYADCGVTRGVPRPGWAASEMVSDIPSVSDCSSRRRTRCPRSNRGARRAAVLLGWSCFGNQSRSAATPCWPGRPSDRGECGWAEADQVDAANASSPALPSAAAPPRTTPSTTDSMIFYRAVCPAYVDVVGDVRGSRNS